MNELEATVNVKLAPFKGEPTLKRIFRRRIRIDPRMVRRFNIKLGERDCETFSTPRGDLDWTKSEGRNSAWADIEELAESIKKRRSDTHPTSLLLQKVHRQQRRR